MTTLTPVKSSNIAAVGHDPETQELHVKFHSGAVHAYSGVSAEKHQALLAASSIGSHFHKNILKAHKSRKVSG